MSDDAYPVGPVFLWLMYAECPTCEVEAKQPCVGQRFSPHEGRPTWWDKEKQAWTALRERVRAAVDEMGAQAVGNGDAPTTDTHGKRGSAKWLVSERDSVKPLISERGQEPAVFEGGHLCHCGELFVRTAGQGGMRMADLDLMRHETDATDARSPS